MSFGAFSLFNFFQQPNTGFQPASLDTGILANNNAASGKVADFNWYFPYVNTNILNNAVLSQSRFGYHIWADSQGAVVPGIHYATASTSLSGSFGANYNSIYFTEKVYGVVFPQIHEVFSEYSMFSGLLTGVHFNNIFQSNTFSGLFTGQRNDVAYISNAFSGDIRSSADPFFLNTTFSGIINKAPHDAFTGDHELTGSFWGSRNDLCSLSYAFAGYSISKGVTIISDSGSDLDNISFTLIGYQVNS